MSSPAYRKRFKLKYWSDPEFRARVLKRRRQLYRERYRGSSKTKTNPAQRRAYLEEKIKRCPEFARLLYLETTVHRLRLQIEAHQEEILQEEKRLVSLVREREKLRKYCRGK